MRWRVLTVCAACAAGFVASAAAVESLAAPAPWSPALPDASPARHPATPLRVPGVRACRFVQTVSSEGGVIDYTF